jgi:hypothetical protein
MSSLNYTLPILQIKSSIHSRTLATDTFLRSLPYRTELSTANPQLWSNPESSPAVSRPVCLGIKHTSEAYDQFLLLSDSCGFVDLGGLSLTRGRVCRLQLLLVLAIVVILGRSPVGLATIFYCLRFEISLFFASQDSQGNSGGIRPRLRTQHLQAAVI